MALEMPHFHPLLLLGKTNFLGHVPCRYLQNTTAPDPTLHAPYLFGCKFTHDTSTVQHATTSDA